MKRGFANEAHAPACVEWYTPKYIFDALGLTFALDVAAPPGGGPHVPSDRFYTRADDGLAMPWVGRVWCNPPYGKETPRWLSKLVEHGDGVGLVMSRTETGWFHDLAARAGAICFVRRRVRHIPGPGASRAGQPANGSMLLAFGRDCVDAVSRCGLGLVVRP